MLVAPNRAPEGVFELNRESQQARGLVGWVPLLNVSLIDRVRGLIFTQNGSPVWVADSQYGQALSFNGTTQYLSAGAVLTAPPITMACWFITADNINSFTAMGLGLSGSVDHQFNLQVAGSIVGDPVRAQTKTTTSVQATSTTGYSVNVWQHGCVVFASAIDRRAYVNGGSEGTNATSRIPVGINSTYIAALQGVSPGNFFPGRIADARIYNRALSPAEIYQLYDPATRWELYRPIQRMWQVKAPAATGHSLILGDNLSNRIFGGFVVR